MTSLSYAPDADDALDALERTNPDAADSAYDIADLIAADPRTVPKSAFQAVDGTLMYVTTRAVRGQDVEVHVAWTWNVDDDHARLIVIGTRALPPRPRH